MATIDALLGLGIEDGAETQALADSLRGRKRAADIFSLSTVGNIAKGAQAEQQSVMEGAKRGGVLRQAMADKKSKEEQAQLDRESRESIAEAQIIGRQEVADLDTNEMGKLTSLRWMIDPVTKKSVQVGQDKYGQWHEAGNQNIINNLGDYDEALTANQMAKQLDSLGGMADDVRGLSQSLQNYDEGFAPFAAGGDSPTPFEDIPGAGRFSGKPNDVGWLARQFEERQEDDSALPGDLNTLLATIANTKVRAGAGLSQTITEINNMKRELGSTMFTDPDVTRRVIARIKQAMNTELAEKWAQIPEQVKNQYREQLGDQPNPFEHQFEALSFPADEKEAAIMLQQSEDAVLAKIAANNKRLEELKAQKAAN